MAQVHLQQPYRHQPLPRLEEQEPTTLGQQFAPDQMDAEIREVLQARVADASRKTYDDYNTRLIRFLFDHCNEFPNVINPSIMGELSIAHDNERNTRTSRGAPSKKRLHINSTIRKALSTINPADTATHPLLLEKLSFYIIACFMKTFSKQITTHSTAEDLVVTAEAGETTRTVTIRLKPSSYDGVSSSLANLFVECNVSKDSTEGIKEMWRNLGMYKKGTRRKGARERQALGLRTTEGKDPIPLAAYTHLASILNRSNDPEHVAAHLFLLLDWNLMSRADFVVTSNIELVGVWNDALRFQVGVTKTDQEGSKHIDHPFHVYSCPENPVICPVLALSKHLLCNPRILLGKCKLFEGQISMKDLTASCAQLSGLMNIVLNSLILVYTQSTLEHIQCGRVQHLMWLVALLLALQ